MRIHTVLTILITTAFNLSAVQTQAIQSTDFEGLQETATMVLNDFQVTQPPVAIDLGDARSPEVVAMIRRVKDYVGRLVTYDDQGNERGHGSAFFIANNKLITNEHVVKGADRAVFHVLGKEYPISGVSRFHPSRDQVELIIDRTEGNYTQVQEDEPELAESVWVIGSPLGFDETVSDGIVSGVREDLLQITAPINPGNSGGPIFVRNGNVVGVATFTLQDSQNMNFGYRVLKDGWVSWEKPLSLSDFQLRRIFDGQLKTFPLMLEKVDSAKTSILKRYRAKEHVIEAVVRQKLTDYDIRVITEVLLERDSLAIKHLDGLAKMLHHPLVDHGDKLLGAVANTLNANDDIILSICALHGLPEEHIDQIRDNGGTISVPGENWDKMIAIIHPVNSADANLIQELLICNFVVCLQYFSLSQ